ncbi:hypothetical protein BGZ81_010863 [Podila clonocystis]|nr:hypothetical protein BGZ81_010863 [Podila clonocystis]
MPQTSLLRKNTKVVWTPAAQEAFGALIKTALRSGPVLRYCYPLKSSILETDASDYALVQEMVPQVPTKNAGENTFCFEQDSEEWSDYEDHPHHCNEYGMAAKDGRYINQDEEDIEEDQENNLGPEIYGDFHLWPRKRTPKPDTKPYSATKARQETTALARHELTMLMYPLPAVIPPEIIRIVCSFASQRTLCHVLMLVCREWYYLAKPFVKRTGKWHCGTQDAEDTLLEKMRARQINELRLYHKKFATIPTTGREKPFNNVDSAWTRFFSAITTPVYLTRNDSTLKGLGAVADIMETMVLEDTAVPKQCLLASVQQILVSSWSLWQPCLMPALLPYFSKIHTLTLFQDLRAGSIPLFTILDNCHDLQDLSINGSAAHAPIDMAVCTGNTPPDIIPATSTYSGEINLWRSYPLKKFSVSGMALELGALKRLIQSCPQMQEFMASDIAIWIFQGHITVKVPQNDTHLHFAPLYRLAASHCPNLSRFCLSGFKNLQRYAPDPRANDVTDAEALQHFNLTLELFPHARAMSLPTITGGFWEPDRDTCLYLSRLTHLTITQSLNFVKNLDTILRCAHSLVSLIAPKVLFSAPDPLRIEDDYKRTLDIVRKKRLHREWVAQYQCYYVEASNARDAKVQARIRHRLKRHATAARGRLPHPSRWMCTHLKTLDISVESPAVNSRHPSPLGPKRFFEFLARSCSQLENVTLRMVSLHLGQRTHTREHMLCIPPRKPARLRAKCLYHRCGTCEAKDVFKAFENDLLALCHDGAAREAPRLVHLRQLKIVAESVPGYVCASDFDFLGKFIGGGSGSGQVPWPALELFQITSGNGWAIRDHPRATETGKETIKSLQMKVKTRRPCLDLQLLKPS